MSEKHTAGHDPLHMTTDNASGAGMEFPPLPESDQDGDKTTDFRGRSLDYTADDMQEYAAIHAQAHNAKLEAQVERLREALESIRQYGSDTLSGRVDGPDDHAWQREAVREMRNRALVALKP